MSLPLKWGFFGAGKITRDFVTALKLLPVTKHIAVAIASQSLENAKVFSDENGLKKAYGSYEELARDSEVDVVYIGTLNSQHFRQAKLAIEHGKHVLCEKPLCITYQQGRELVDFARERNVFLMEGFWTTLFPAFMKFDEEVKNGSIGKILQLLVITGNKFGGMDRFKIKELGGGCTINHGVYGLYFAHRYFGIPDKIVASGLLSDSGVDIATTISLTYEKEAQCATIILDSRVTLPGEMYLIGTEGTLKLCYPFWCPTRVETPKGIFQFDLPSEPDGVQRESYNYINGSGFTYEAEEVRNCIQKGLLESSSNPLEDSVQVYKMADEVRRQLTVHFPEDSKSQEPTLG